MAFLAKPDSILRMTVQGFHHLALQVEDLTRTTAFYQELVGLSELARHHRDDGTLRSVWLAVPGGAFLAIEQASGSVEDSPFRTDRLGFHLLALRILPAHRAEWMQKFTRAGFPVVHETRWTFYVRDPEGNRVAFSHHPED